jgi:hypothetical protein
LHAYINGVCIFYPTLLPPVHQIRPWCILSLPVKCVFFLQRGRTYCLSSFQLPLFSAECSSFYCTITVTPQPGLSLHRIKWCQLETQPSPVAWILDQEKNKISYPISQVSDKFSLRNIIFNIPTEKSCILAIFRVKINFTVEIQLLFPTISRSLFHVRGVPESRNCQAGQE